MAPNRSPISETDRLDTLSAIWILSCNDDNPIMTYRSIVHRLGLPDGYDIKGLVRSRSELFRPGILKSRLDTWKHDMRTGKSLPGWLVEITDPQTQREEIEKLSREDVFRNQFRVERGAKKCSVEIIEWGLRHIERLRKDWSDENDGKYKRFSSVWIPAASLFLVLASMIVTSLIQLKSIQSQERLKFYEVDFKPKLDSYSTFMDELMVSVLASSEGNDNELRSHLNKMEAAFYRFEPFLVGARRVQIFVKFTAFTKQCLAFAKVRSSDRGADDELFVREIANLKAYFRTVLFEALFSEGSAMRSVEGVRR